MKSSLDNDQVMFDEKDILSVDDMMEEEILLGLRKRKGLSKKSFFDKYNIELLDAFPNIIKLINEGLLEYNDDFIFIKKEYQYIFEDITDLMEQQNVDPYRSEPGDDFDASIHQPKLEPTTDPASDKKVKESVSEGYKKDGKILIPEKVIVYQYKA